MKVVDCVLTAITVLENVSGSLGEDACSDCNDDGDSGPEEGHEDPATAVFEYAGENQVAVE